jgi:hypothetical protein
MIILINGYDSICHNGGAQIGSIANLDPKGMQINNLK